jgi:predicted ATPase/DNA-binding winged helix-turn-helix (wHTH) protein
MPEMISVTRACLADNIYFNSSSQPIRTNYLEQLIFCVSSGNFPMEKDFSKIFTFDDFKVDAERRVLLKNGETVALNSKTFDLLLILVENHGQILSKDELLEKVWEGQFVEENNLTVHISAIRKALGEKKGEPQFIVTIPGKGYKFIAEIRQAADEIITLKLDSNSNYAITPVALPEYFAADESFVGREQETAEIKDLLRLNGLRLLTLTGAGGTGKTRLAQVVAQQLKADFSDGVFFVELAAVTDAEFVVSAIAQTLDVTESAGKSLLETLTDFLQRRRILLVLDNFEHLLSAAPLVKELLENTYSLKVLTTSRAPLRLHDELEFKLSPLEFPSSDSAISLDEITEFSAVKLFCKRAQTAKPTFLLTETNFAAVTEICCRLDGLPLAIELAAARIKLLSPQSILERLKNSLQLLTGGTKDAPARQRTIRDAIQWSYDLLADEEKFLFRRLAIFAGGFTVEAAETVVSSQWSVVSNKEENLTTDHRPPTTTLDLLGSLVDCNLLVSREQADGNVRLRMLEVVREFAFEILEKAGELVELQQLHANYFLSLAENAEKYLLTETGSEWLEKLENEHDNLRAALGWALANDKQTATRMAAALRFFWLNHNHLTEGFRWSKAALEATENDFSEARSKLLLSNGLFLLNRGELAAAQKSYEKTLAESREIKDLPQIIKANHGLGAIAVLQKDFAAAQSFLEESLNLSRQLNDEMQTAYSLCSLGNLEMTKGDFLAARPPLEECLQLAKKLGNDRLLTTTHYNLGTIDYHENKYHSAAFNFTESFRIARQMNDKTMISCSLDGFAALAAVEKNYELAAKLSGAAENLREEIGFQIEPAEEIFRHDYLTKIHRALDEKTFHALYEQGKTADVNETAALLLKENFSAGNQNEFSEIIIETHSIERIIIEEEITDDAPNEIIINQPSRLSAPSNNQEKSSNVFHYLIFAVGLAAIILSFWVWSKSR